MVEQKLRIVEGSAISIALGGIFMFLLNPGIGSFFLAFILLYVGGEIRQVCQNCIDISQNLEKQIGMKCSRAYAIDMITEGAPLISKICDLCLTRAWTWK